MKTKRRHIKSDNQKLYTFGYNKNNDLLGFNFIYYKIELFGLKITILLLDK